MKRGFTISAGRDPLILGKKPIPSRGMWGMAAGVLIQIPITADPTKLVGRVSSGHSPWPLRLLALDQLLSGIHPVELEEAF